MKVMITLLSAIIVFFGIIPFFPKFPIPNTGIGYAIVLIVLGIILMASSFMNNLLMGFEKFFLILQALGLIFISVLNFLPALLPFLPRDGPLYAGMVIAVGAIGFIYGLIGMG